MESTLGIFGSVILVAAALNVLRAVLVENNTGAGNIRVLVGYRRRKIRDMECSYCCGGDP